MILFGLSMDYHVFVLSSIREVLPASMKLLGTRNWYLPKRLAWLPKLEHEPPAAPALS